MVANDALADLPRRRPPPHSSAVSGQNRGARAMGRGDFLSEKYQGLAAGSSKEACELFAEAEDLLGQEQFDTLEIPAMWVF